MNTGPKIHWFESGWINYTACGRLATNLITSMSIDTVTCQHCLKTHRGITK